MAVPDFQTWFLPLMKRIADGNIHEMNSLREEVADDLALSEKDKNEMLPSGKQATYRNRIGWARTYLKKANFLTSPSRGTVRITDRGKDALSANPQDLRVKDLKKYPEFLDFHTLKEKEAGDEVAENENESETPEEKLERIHIGIRKQIELDLLEKVKAASPKFFEGLVVDLLLKMGYGGSREDAGKTVGRSGDGGIDGVINEDRLGLDIVCIQAKRWENSVGRPIVQAFAGSLEGVRAKKGVLITTSEFTKDAEEYVRQIEKKIVLIDGKTLASLMVDNSLGVSSIAQYEVHRIDSDYFDEE
jgi:restriction system protein